MAKKPGTSAGKDKGAKVPKTIAGVKLSKELRSTIEPVLRWAGHPLVSDTLATAMLAGAGALVARKGKGAGAAGARGKAGTATEEDPIGLAIAVSAGEIAARIVAAFNDSRPAAPVRKPAATRSKTKAPPKTTRAKKT